MPCDMGNTPYHVEKLYGFMLLVPNYVLSTNMAQKQPGFVQDPPLNGLMLRSVHWIPVAVHIIFKTLTLAQKAINGSPPVYEGTYHTLLSTRDSITVRLDAASLEIRGRTLSRLVCLGSQVVYERPLDVRTVESLAVFKKHLFTDQPPNGVLKILYS